MVYQERKNKLIVYQEKLNIMNSLPGKNEYNEWFTGKE